jgi:PAS domain S-box-containing protein
MSVDPGMFKPLTTSASSIDEVVEELRTSDQFATQVLAHMPVGTVIQSPSGEIIHGNEAAARILRLTMEQLTGRTSMDPSWRSIHPDGSPYPGDQHPAMQTLQTGAVVVDYMGVRTDDGPATWIHITSLPVCDATGALIGVQSFFVDVTVEIDEQHRQQAQLARADRLSREATDVITVCDAEGVVTSVTGSSSRLLGWGDGTVVGRHLGDCLHARAEVTAALERATSEPNGGAHLTVSMPVTAVSDGATRHVEVRIHNRLDDPILAGVVVTLTDVGERVAVETQLRAVNLDLERRLNELDRSNNLDGILSQASNLLAGCCGIDEVADVLWDLLDQSFSRSDVAVRLDSGGGATLDVVRARRPDDPPVAPESCWAIRTRHVHSASTGGVHCEHRLPSDPSVCIPVIVDGRVIGSATITGDHWPVDSLMLTGEKIGVRIGQVIPAPAVEPRSPGHAGGD